MNGSKKTPPRLPSPPKWLLYVVILFVVVSWIPLAMIARSRAVKSNKPRVHMFLDMDNQPRYEAQSEHPLYADDRAMRPPVPGAVSRTGDAAEAAAFGDDFYHLGYATDDSGEPVMSTRTVNGNPSQSVQWYKGYPEEIEVNRDLLERGRERFDIYCSVCHGEAGYGDGMIARRASDIGAENTPGWVSPVNLHSVNPNTGELLYGGSGYATGKLFNTITNGIRTMPAYGKQIPVADRWAIVSYVKALQFSQHVPAEQVPQDLRGRLRPPQSSGDEGESQGGGSGSAEQGANRSNEGADGETGDATDQPQQSPQSQSSTPDPGA